MQGGFGVLWKITVSSTLTTVVNLEDIEFPEMGNELAEVTNHGSAGGAPEFLATGLKTGAEIKAVLIWDSAQATHAELVTLEGSGASNAMTLADPDGDETVSFSGIVKKIKRITPMKDKITAEVMVQVTGQMTIA